MLPSIFGENLFDDFFNDPFGMTAARAENPLYGKHTRNLMKTDVRETENTYELDIDLPGFKKDEIGVELKDGYLTISAAKGLDKEFRLRAAGEDVGDRAIRHHLSHGFRIKAEEEVLALGKGIGGHEQIRSSKRNNLRIRPKRPRTVHAGKDFYQILFAHELSSLHFGTKSRRRRGAKPTATGNAP